ncbi:DUF4865 family protein [Motilibacter aurantiacus]|uniref:DUF4865 family protein n=1 Tax=Motilibacter aurantiacus TaxID=2714955 RepID=UPI0018C89B97|nr:DUF4865 family protein [Motilibacter aurantiacus]
MHYDIRLPRGYDMRVVRERVASRGHALDDLPGLGLKAYLVRDVAAGDAVNAYAPFYLWTDEAAAARFLWRGGGFQGIVRDFGRPPARTWIAGGCRRGAADEAPYAVTATLRLPPEADPQHVATRADDVLRELDARSLHTAAWAVDPASWELVVFLLQGTPDAPTAVKAVSETCVTFSVLHVSAPELALLA